MRHAYLPLALLALLQLQAHAGTPLEDALAAPADGPLYMFDVVVRNSDTEAMIRVDPSRPEGERLNVISPAEKDWTDDFRKLVKKMDADTDGDIWCRSFGENIPADAALVSESPTTATYTFKPRKGAKPDDLDDVYKYLTGKVVVAKDDPAILSVEMVSDKPFRPLPVAKIKSFKLNFDCARAPDGRTHIARVDVAINGSAMMNEFSESEHQTISNLQPLPDSGTGTK
ncbi:hypothetical protein [Hyphomonas sp.]|uniref:hypothetical protein n=1 Tax=Hyphomonas sp. TaxID=87 RepID=UPI003D2D047F|tara:strand:- start:13529 stop:14212 length:684 start_codon:yes stop_codon:yes gene_type:complete